MDQETVREVRNATEHLRRPPGEPVRIRAAFDGGGEIGEEAAAGPIELTIEATSPDGEVAAWLDDDWWTALIERWGEESVTVHIAPTPGALLHPVTIYQVEMVRRVLPRWRVAGHAYLEDMTGVDDIESLATSPYHELRFIDGRRPGSPQSDRLRPSLSIEALFGQIRREQARLGATRPILVRLPSPATDHTTPS